MVLFLLRMHRDATPPTCSGVSWARHSLSDLLTLGADMVREVEKGAENVGKALAGGVSTILLVDAVLSAALSGWAMRGIKWWDGGESRRGVLENSR